MMRDDPDSLSLLFVALMIVFRLSLGGPAGDGRRQSALGCGLEFDYGQLPAAIIPNRSSASGARMFANFGQGNVDVKIHHSIFVLRDVSEQVFSDCGI
jgi:hypothetical protein